MLQIKIVHFLQVQVPFSLEGAGYTLPVFFFISSWTWAFFVGHQLLRLPPTPPCCPSTFCVLIYHHSGYSHVLFYLWSNFVLRCVCIYGELIHHMLTSLENSMFCQDSSVLSSRGPLWWLSSKNSVLGIYFIFSPQISQFHSWLTSWSFKTFGWKSPFLRGLFHVDKVPNTLSTY